MVLGDILAGWRRDELDYRAVVFCGSADEGPGERVAGNLGVNAFLDIYLRRVVGRGRTDVWTHHALPGHVAGDGGGDGQLRGVRDAGAAHLSRPVWATAGAALRG